jgi:hypothetical protein
VVVHVHGGALLELLSVVLSVVRLVVLSLVLKVQHWGALWGQSVVVQDMPLLAGGNLNSLSE